ncbi:hydrolase [Spirochaetia bacterium]|nr:hydrolase [Spirochaetia bacterium]
MVDLSIPESSGEIKVEETWFDTADAAKIFLRRWIPQGEKRAVLHIVHGMAEHGLRYDRFARRLCAQGIEVWAADQRGHGRTADLTVNKRDRGGLLGHSGDPDGIALVQRDIHAINTRIKAAHTEIPLFLLGHSWGSFLAQYYIEEHSRSISGCILSGTRGPGGLIITLGAPVMALIALLRGSRRGSKLARAFADGPYSKPFKPNRTSFDWLSRDKKEVDAYIDDPVSGMLCSSGFYRDITALLNTIHRPSRMEAIRKDLPVYVFAGNSDPVGDMGNSPTALVDAYRALGITDLEFVLYPGARHETLNETNRDEVMEDCIAWLDKHIET